MKLRPIQLVCLALLLATLRLADPTALAPGDFALRAGVLNVLLRSELAVEWTSPATRRQPENRIPAPRFRSAPEAPLQAQAPLAMAPPASHSAAVQSHTGLRRA